MNEGYDDSIYQGELLKAAVTIATSPLADDGDQYQRGGVDAPTREEARTYLRSCWKAQYETHTEPAEEEGSAD